VAKFDSAELEHVDLEATCGEVAEQAFDEFVRHVTQEKCAVTKVHAYNAERLLLGRCFFVEHAYVHDDLAGLIVCAALEFYSHPAVALVSPAIAPGHYGIGESEERSVIAALRPEALDVELKFVIEHRLQPVARNVAVRVSVDGVAHLHVVSRHALCDRAG